MESNGALARREIFKFNFIHDYDVIIIGHARALEQGYWYAIAADECLKALCHAIRADCLLMKPDAPTR